MNMIFRFPRGSKRSSYTKLYVEFFLYELIHLTSDFISAKRMTYGPFKFYLLLPVTVTFENLVIYLVKCLLRLGGIELKFGKTDGSWVVRVVGHCWVVLWLCLTLPVLTGEQSVIGFYATDRGPIARFLFDTWKHAHDVYTPLSVRSSADARVHYRVEDTPFWKPKEQQILGHRRLQNEKWIRRVFLRTRWIRGPHRS